MAHLLVADGEERLARRIARTTNYAFLSEMRDEVVEAEALAP